MVWVKKKHFRNAHNGKLKEEVSTTLRHIVQIFGLVNFAMCYLRTNRARWYYLLKFLRRRTGQPLDSPAYLWSHLRTALPIWIAEILNAPPYIYPRHDIGETSTFSDACPDGLGGVIIHSSGHFDVIARPTTAQEKRLPINTLETIAARWVLQHVPHGPSPISMFIDNTSAIAWTKGRVPRDYCAAQIAENLQDLPTYHRVVSVLYIPSALNLAERPSRNPWSFQGARTQTIAEPMRR